MNENRLFAGFRSNRRVSLQLSVSPKEYPLFAAIDTKRIFEERYPWNQRIHFPNSEKYRDRLTV